MSCGSIRTRTIRSAGTSSRIASHRDSHARQRRRVDPEGEQDREQQRRRDGATEHEQGRRRDPAGRHPEVGPPTRGENQEHQAEEQGALNRQLPALVPGELIELGEVGHDGVVDALGLRDRRWRACSRCQSGYAVPLEESPRSAESRPGDALQHDLALRHLAGDPVLQDEGGGAVVLEPRPRGDDARQHAVDPVDHRRRRPRRLCRGPGLGPRVPQDTQTPDRFLGERRLPGERVDVSDELSARRSATGRSARRASLPPARPRAPGPSPRSEPRCGR